MPINAGGAGSRNFIDELWIAIRADITQLQEGIRASQAEIATFAGRMGDASANLRKFGTTVSLISGALLVLQGIAIKTFAKFEQSMANTFSVIGANQEQMRRLTEYAREMGATTIFSASQAADAMYYLGSAGYNTNQVIGALKGTLDLAASTQYDLAETTRIVVGALNAFGLQATEATRVANVFAAVIAYSQAEMDKIGESMKYVAPIAAALNISLEQVSAALGVLYNAGLDASQSGTSMRQIFLKLQDPTHEAVDAIKSLGLTLEQVNPQTHDLVEILRAFEKAGAGAADKGDELAKIFDARAVTAFQILVRQGADALVDMEKKITGTNKASQMAEIQINTLMGSFKLLRAQAQEMAIAFGTGIVGALRVVTDEITILITSFNNLGEGFKSTFAQITLLGSALGLLTGLLAILLSKIPAIIGGLKSLQVVIGIGFGKIMLLVAAIGAVVYAIEQWITADARREARTKKLLSTLQNQINAQIEAKKNTKDLADEYVALTKNTDKTEQQQKRYVEITNKLNDLYPDLLSNTDNMNTKIQKMETVSKNAAGEVDNLGIQLKKLRDIELSIEIAKSQKAIKEMQDDLKSGTNLWDDFVATLPVIGGTNFGNLIDGMKNMNLATADLIEKSVRTNAQLNLMQVSTADLQTKLERMSATEDGITKIKSDQEQVTNKIFDLQNELLKTTGTDMEGNIQSSLDAWQDINDVYTDVLVKNSELLTEQENLNNLVKEQKDLREGVVEAPGAPPAPPIVPTDPNLTDEEKRALEEKQKKLNELKFNLQKSAMENELAIAELYADKSLEKAIAYADKEYEYNKFLLERQRDERLAIAKEVGYDEQEVLKQFNDDKIALEVATNQKILQIKDQFNAEATDRLKKLALERDAMMENELRYRVDKEMHGEFGFDGSLERYRQYLYERLGYEKEFSNEYMNIRQTIDELESSMRERQTADIVRYTNVALSGIESAFNQMWNQWVIGTRRAKDEWDAVWLAMKYTALRAIQDILTSAALKALMKILLTLFGTLFGGIGGGAATSFIPSPSPISATGALVKKGGNMIVHPDEIVVPAHVVRRNRKDYENALGDDKGNMSGKGSNVFIENKFVLNNPIVNDKRYWEAVIEKNLEPSMQRFKKRFNS